MRFAKLEQNIITAFFCTMFDFSLESEDGTALAETVAVNTNNYTANKPDEKMYLRYSVRKEVL
jgi:sterol 14-demethylase